MPFFMPDPDDIAILPIPDSGRIVTATLTATLTPSPTTQRRLSVHVALAPPARHDALSELYTYPDQKQALHLTDPLTGHGLALAICPRTGEVDGWFPIAGAVDIADIDAGVPAEWATLS